MKTNSKMDKIKSFLKEITIVTIGVLIALFFSSLKEKNQAKKYHIASIKTIKNEVEENYSELKKVMGEQTRLLDTINYYSENQISIYAILRKANGLQLPTLSNTGLEFYTRNQINSIDFEMMSKLIQMNMLSELIDSKLEKLMDFLYPNIFVDSKESKLMVKMYLQNTLESEDQLINVYKKFIDENIQTRNTVNKDL